MLSYFTLVINKFRIIFFSMSTVTKGDTIKIETQYVKCILTVDKVLGKRVYYTVIDSNYNHDYEDLKYEDISHIDEDIISTGENIKVIKQN